MIPDSPQNPTAHDPTDRHPDGRGPVQQPGSAAPSGSSALHDRTHGGFRPTPLRLAVYILLGAFFGVVIVKSVFVILFVLFFGRLFREERTRVVHSRQCAG